MKKLAFFGVCLLALASCSDGQQKADSALSQRVDSLSQIIAQKDNEINDMMSTFNEIEEGFHAISEAQDRVAVAKSGEGANTKERLRENIRFIQNTMKQNKELINKLKQQVRESSVKGDQLKKIIDNLTEQMQQKDQQLQALREELDRKDIHIAELDEQVADLNENVANLKQENTQKAETISTQDKQINSAWFVFGTKKELKEQNILDKGEVLQANFNKDYFTKIDIRIDKEIKLYSSSAEILTNHPAGSYTLQRDAKKQYVLRITDPQAFWSTSKYLVVQVK